MDRHFISPRDLFAILHLADAPRVLDLRDAGDAAADPRRIPGAGAVTLADLERCPDPEPGRPAICSCQKGGKLSQLGAAILRSQGTDARSLIGGHLAWIAADLPLMTATPPPARWVMPIDPSWPEVASLWVLRRLVDRAAPVMAVERSWLEPAAAVWDADILPSDPAKMAARMDMAHPAIPHLRGGPERLLAGRLSRAAAPEDALDLIDDWLAAPEVAA